MSTARTAGLPAPSRPPGEGLPIALLLPGQGAQQPGMATGLYQREPVFTASMDAFFELMGREGTELRQDWLAEHPRVPLDDASRAQPLLFAVGYALGRSLLERGVRPAVMLGHSVGELAAAALAGVFDLAAAARLMSARSAAMAATAPGGMLAVAARPEDLAHLVAGRSGGGRQTIAVGAVNAPAQTVLSGLEPHLSEVAAELAGAGVTARRVPALQAFHTPAIAGAADAFRRAFDTVPLHAPSIPVRSTRTGRLVTPAQAVDGAFWAEQLAEPVLFWPALDSLLRQGDFLLMEAGPGQSLSMLARRHPHIRARRSRVLPLLPARAGDDLGTFLAAVSHVHP
ncbi:Acyl transferase domain-containing protein [Actinacidiphila yanglinensis]|uniref:Acyl transferase domain-containing protein n=1 Tax=Actinacidiphila yanglinensis TaxID=310779 RepID=A0A1H6E760_9ACTN|nr:acyltransferase domain-containing protein [Actinacidiphila yanglinensis]SEG93580.1 Acyl transferase domain-containing protein [Actinacidiphila yanglinensis]